MATVDKRLKYYILTFIAISIFLYIILVSNSMDNDMFFEIASGRDILNGNFYNASKLNNQPIIVQQWLYCTCLALLDQLGDIWLYLFVIIQNMILWLLSTIFLYRKTNSYIKSLFGSFVILILCSGYLVNIRPQIITMIFILLELIILDIYIENRQRSTFLWLIPIFILSANFHNALFLYHIYILIPFCFTKIENKYRIDKRLLIFIPVFILCSTLTPYGIPGALYTLNSFASGVFSKIAITELSPISLSYYNMITIVCYLIVAQTIWLIYKHKANKYTIYYTFTIFLFAATSIRHLSIMYVACLYILIQCDFKVIKHIKKYICIMCIWFFIQSALLYRVDNIGYLKSHKEVIEANVSKTNDQILNSIMLGGYLEYLGYNVYSDARPEIFTELMCGEDKVTDIVLYLFGKDIKTKQYVNKSIILDKLQNYNYLVLDPSDYINTIVDIDYNKIFSDNQLVIWKRK